MVELGLNVAANLPETTVAMFQVAKAAYSQDLWREKGVDDYGTPFDKLMSAFDSFILELSGRKQNTGSLENYDMSKSRDLTIYLLWQIRNIRTHSGGLISESQEAKERYERQFKLGGKRGTNPMINLPEILDPGNEITFNFQDFMDIKNLIFEYIGERIPKSDFAILQARSSVANIKTEQVMVALEFEGLGWVEIDLAEAYEIGCNLSPTGFLSFPPYSRYFRGMNKICVTTTFKCLTVHATEPIGKKDKKKKK